MRFGRPSLLALAAALHVSAASASPVALTLDGSWFDFAVGDVADVWRSPLDGEPISFTLTSAVPFTLRVVDVGFAGDRVEVVSGGATALGFTALVVTDDTVFAFTPDEAFAAPATWSQGQWLLASGDYTFTGAAAASPFGGGAWAISALAVPEPGSWALMLSGLALAGLLSRRRR